MGEPARSPLLRRGKFENRIDHADGNHQRKSRPSRTSMIDALGKTNHFILERPDFLALDPFWHHPDCNGLPLQTTGMIAGKATIQKVSETTIGRERAPRQTLATKLNHENRLNEITIESPPSWCLTQSGPTPIHPPICRHLILTTKQSNPMMRPPTTPPPQHRPHETIG